VGTGVIVSQLLQIFGAMLILAAFTAIQAGWLDTRSALYLLLNIVGAFTLAVLAWYERQWGFLLLEGVWTVVSVWSFVAVVVRRRRPAP
jgi:hypothetical protein